MKEKPNNIVLQCPEHSPQPNPNLVTAPLEQYIGTWVKKSFPVIRGQYAVEHMWVHVTNAADGKLVGTLDNDPVNDCGVCYGDTVTVDPQEVEDLITDTEA